jgi:hypothetical protein
MQDMQTYFEKLHRDAVDCALISKRATDARKKELFDWLRRLGEFPVRGKERRLELDVLEAEGPAERPVPKT